MKIPQFPDLAFYMESKFKAKALQCSETSELVVKYFILLLGFRLLSNGVRAPVLPALKPVLYLTYFHEIRSAPLSKRNSASDEVVVYLSNMPRVEAGEIS